MKVPCPDQPVSASAYVYVRRPLMSAGSATGGWNSTAKSEASIEPGGWSVWSCRWIFVEMMFASIGGNP
ncbi:MAG TPA: hypothetical protein PL072_09700 [Phycisphaerales bacterium]|nr:hypothetical protein [Phycisphaerales bacterium]